MPNDWRDLPFLVRVAIFSFLSPQERFTASQVCSTWRSACEYPGLWRDVSLHISRDLYEGSAPTRIMLAKNGHCIQKLSVVGDPIMQAITYRSLSQQRNIRPANGFWDYLWEVGVKPKHLCLQNWKRSNNSVVESSHWHDEFLSFVRSQTQLESLTIKNVNLSIIEWLTVLEALRGCKNEMKVLTIIGGLTDHLDINNHSSYLIPLSNTQNLHHLSLDYRLCSDSALYALAEGASCLTTFVITFFKPISEALSDRAWSSLITACPKLAVIFIFKSGSVDYNVLQAFNASLPLKSLTFSCATSQDPTRFSVKALIKMIIHRYQHCLESLELRLGDNIEYLDNKIISILEQCSRLKKFLFIGVIREISTLWKICEFLRIHPERFQVFCNRPKFLNHVNNMEMRENYGIYKEYLRQSDISLTFDDSSIRRSV